MGETQTLGASQMILTTSDFLNDHRKDTKFIENDFLKQFVGKKINQQQIVCEFEFVRKTTDGTAKPSKIVSHSAEEVFYQSVD